MTKHRRLEKRRFGQTRGDQPIGTKDPSRNPETPVLSTGIARNPTPTPGIKTSPESPGRPGSDAPTPGINVISQTPSQPIIPGHPLTKGQYLDLERAQRVAQFQPGCDLPNPDHAPPFDRTQPLGRVQKREALGFRPATDDLIELKHGDAWNSKTNRRRTQYFSQLVFPQAIINPEINPIGLVANDQSGQGIAEMHSQDPERLKLFQVSLFSIGVRRVSVDTLLTPLTEQEIINNQLVGIQGGPNVPGQLFSSVSMNRFRILVQDVSGGRYFDVDVMGTRSINVWAYGVTVFSMIPDGGYEVRTSAGGQDPGPQQGFGGLVEDSIVGARIFQMALEDGDQFKDQVTAQVRVDADSDPPTPLSPTGSVLVPVPPGAREVQGYCAAPGLNAQRLAYTSQFDAGLALPQTSLGQIVLDPVTGRTPSPILVPNCNNIAFIPQDGALLSSFTLVWTVTV